MHNYGVCISLYLYTVLLQVVATAISHILVSSCKLKAGLKSLYKYCHQNIIEHQIKTKILLCDTFAKVLVYYLVD